MTVGLLRLALLLIVVAGCAPGPAGSTVGVTGRATAGPTCPVEPASPAPGQCSPRPVGGAVLVITNTAGAEVGRVTTAPDGSFAVSLPAGSYVLTPQHVDGILGVGRPVPFTIGAGASPILAVEYDTGIR